MENLSTPVIESIDALHDRIVSSEPKIVTLFVPDNAAEQKQAFMDNKVRNPSHVYSRLESADLDAQSAIAAEMGAKILSHPALNPKYVSVYEEFVDGLHDKYQFLKLAKSYNQARSSDDKRQIGEEFMQINANLYESPNEETYRSLLQDKITEIKNKQLSGQALQIREELLDLVKDSTAERIDRFKPSSQTVEWVHTIAESLYSDMLSHIPDQPTFTVEETRDIFAAILREEFGDAASEWKVDIEEAKSITVKSSERRIVIPENRGEISYAKLRGLVVHEIGVHTLRSIMGYETDLRPLSTGLSGSYDAEEGLGMVMEQALKNEYSESGVGLYITAGAAYHDQKDFRDVFEMNWRLSALGALENNTELSEQAILKAKNTAYAITMRVMRGTDNLPWFKDLAYYNGSSHMWQHLESIRGDDTKFMFVLLGKVNPGSAEHERIQFETKSV